MSDTVAKVLAKFGVFKGFEGLEGLANAAYFWDRQAYGTRIYYGPGIADYLHRDVLGAAITVLKDYERLERENAELRKALDRYTRMSESGETLGDHLDLVEAHMALERDCAELREQLEQAEATSEGRRITLLEKAEELRKEWARAERAEAMLGWWVRWTEDINETINDPMTEKWRSVLREKLAETKLLIGAEMREPE